jgi:hypothetical protein
MQKVTTKMAKLECVTRTALESPEEALECKGTLEALLQKIDGFLIYNTEQGRNSKTHQR